MSQVRLIAFTQPIELEGVQTGEEQFIGFLRGQVIKYQWRLGKKDSSVQDNKKAIWYATKLDEVLNEA